MSDARPAGGSPSDLLTRSTRLCRADTVEAAVAHTVELAEAAFVRPVVSVHEYDPDTDTVAPLETPAPPLSRPAGDPDGTRRAVAERSIRRSDRPSTDEMPEATVDDDPREPLGAEALVPVGGGRVLCLGVTDADELDGEGVATVEAIGASLETALIRTDDRRTGAGAGAAEPERPASLIRETATPNPPSNESRASAEAFGETVERLLSFGCEYLGLETGILSHVDADADDYEIEAAFDLTGTHEPGAVYDLGETMCTAALADDGTGPLAFADVSDTEHDTHPAADEVRAYIAAAVETDDGVYGTVNFSMKEPRATAFGPAEREFVALVARWIGTEIERRRRIVGLERYETILGTIDDPVYALDTDGRLAFVNDAMEREFGYGPEHLGEHVSIGMEETDVGRVREQVARLLDTDERSRTTEFELETADGTRRIVESRIAPIGEDEFRGTAGVLRDVTADRERVRELGSFRRAVDEAADGVAVLEDGEYVYVDRTHVEMYGFDGRSELLGNSWRKLYDDDEIARLEREAFPALEADGYWRGKVTGSRPDGSTFPAELSLTIVDDGRLVCTVRDETERRERERELELKERAMDEADVGIQITDSTREENPLIYVNEGFERMTGCASEEVLGRSPRFLRDEAADPETVARLRTAIDADEPVSLERRNRRQNGTPYWSRLSVTPVTDENGSVTNHVCIQQDVTERRERDRRRREFLNHGPLMFVETRRVDGEAIVDTCTDRFLRRLGYDRAEVEGEPLASLYTADSATALREGGYDDALAGTFSMDERTLVDADGNRVHTLLRAAPRQGETTGTNALFVDVTERRRHEQRQTARVELLERVYELTTDPTLEFDEKLAGLLNAGREYLNLPHGFLTRIERGEKGTGTQTIVQARSSHDRLQPGESGPISESYCRKTIERDDVTVLTDEDLVDGPAYRTFGLDAYIGDRVVAGDELYGTVCFAADEARDGGFDEFERSFVSLLGRWAGYEIDRRAAHQEVQQQRRQLELTLAGTDTGLVEWNQETDEVWCNETLVGLVGRDVGSIQEFEQTVHPDDRGRVREGLEGMLRNGDPWIGEFRTCGDGTTWLRMRAVRRHEDEAPSRVLAVATDITDRKREERDRKRNERRFRSLFEDPGTLVGLLDTDGTVLDVNETALSYVDAALGDVRGDRLWETPWWSHSEDVRADLRRWIRRAAEGEYVDFEVPNPGPDDETRYIAGTVRPVTDETGSVGSLVISGHDVTERRRRQRDLIEERERFRLLTESVEEYAFLVVDENGTVRTWNEGASELFGWDAETAVGRSIADLRPAADRATGRVGRLLQQARIAGESADEGWRVRADGSEFYADVRYAPLGDDGSATEFGVIVRDMTDKRRQRRRTERFVEESDEVVTVLDADGTVTYASGSATQVLDHDPDDLVGQNLFDHLHPADREVAMEAFFDAVETSGASLQAECRLRSGDGEWLNVEGRCRNMLDDDAVGGMLLYLRDVTESKKRARRFESIFNQTFQFTGLLEPDGTVVEANDAAVEFGGFDRDEIVGEPFHETPWWSHSEAAREDVREALDEAARGRFVRYETEVRGGDGLATIDFSVKPVTDDSDEVTLLVAEGRDITARRRWRRHLDVVQRVMRHNMRNDLTKMRGWAEVLRDGSDERARRESFRRLEGVLDRWERMTEKMSEIRQVMSTGGDRTATTEAASIVENVASAARESHPGATIETDVEGAGSAQVVPTVSTAMRELIDNAVAAATDATIEIRASPSTDDSVTFEIRDDGPGLPEMEAEVLATGEESSLCHGQGLGLWMVRAIVSRAGGDVSVDVTPDGTTVGLWVPTGRHDAGTTP